jgi:hypothetical protein
VGIGQYVTVDDYVSIDGTPLNDQLTLDGYEEALGLEQDLGMEMDLGDMYADLGDDFANRHLGGVSRSAMRAPIGHKKYLAPVPERSFTAAVPHINDMTFDKPDKLYTGIFGGGFGGSFTENY